MVNHLLINTLPFTLYVITLHVSGHVTFTILTHILQIEVFKLVNKMSFWGILPLKMDTNLTIQLSCRYVSMDVHIHNDTSYFTSIEAGYFQFCTPT